jgi:hypothetical protein
MISLEHFSALLIGEYLIFFRKSFTTQTQEIFHHKDDSKPVWSMKKFYFLLLFIFISIFSEI